MAKSSGEKKSRAGAVAGKRGGKPVASVKSDRLALFSVEKAPDSVFWIDKTASIMYGNESACQSLGYSRDELLKLKVYDIDQMFVKDHWLEHWESLKTRGSAVIESIHTRKDGTTFPVEVAINYLAVDGSEIHCAIARDRSERTVADDALRSSEEKFRTLAEQSPSMIFINNRGRIVYANVRCEEIMGYSRPELYEDGFDFFDLVAPECREMASRNLKQHMHGKEVAPFEYELLTKSGTRIAAAIATKLIRYDDGMAIMGIVTDVSELKTAQEHLKTSATALKKQKKELEKKNVALKEILAQIETEKMDLKRQVSSNIDKLITPIIRELRRKGRPSDLQYLDAIESGLNSLTSGFGARISESLLILTPRELEIVGLIRDGMATKEIADLVGVSLSTIENHRNKIRKKLEIPRETSLSSYLQQIQ